MNEMERQGLGFALRGEHPAREALREQLAIAVASAREYTGVGCFTHFAVPGSARRLPVVGQMVIGDPRRRLLSRMALWAAAGMLPSSASKWPTLISQFISKAPW